jgi:hypothetical protein
MLARGSMAAAFHTPLQTGAQVAGQTVSGHPWKGDARFRNTLENNRVTRVINANHTKPARQLTRNDGSTRVAKSLPMVRY